jgi:hypothetical protein
MSAAVYWWWEENLLGGSVNKYFGVTFWYERRGQPLPPVRNFESKRAARRQNPCNLCCCRIYDTFKQIMRMGHSRMQKYLLRRDCTTATEMTAITTTTSLSHNFWFRVKLCRFVIRDQHNMKKIREKSRPTMAAVTATKM